MNLPKMEVPTFEVVVPSTGKKVKLRPFLVKEHKAMMMMNSSTSEEVVEVIKQITATCSFEKLDVNQLAEFDLTYLFLKLREKSIGEVVELTVKCPSCDHVNPTTINLKDVKVIKTPDHTNKFDIGQSDEGLVGIEMSYPKLEDVVKLYDNPTIENVFEMTRMCMKGIYTDDKYINMAEVSDDVFRDWFDSLQKEQLDTIEKFFVTMPRITQDVNVQCSNCQEQINYKIEGIQFFFV